MTGLKFTVILFSLSLILGEPAVQAGNGVPNLLPFQGRLTDTTGSPINYSVTVNFRFYPPSGVCYVYEDTQTVTPNAYGVFSVLLGISANSTGPANTIAQVFNNDPAVPLPNSCAGTYNPASNDWRLLQIVVNGTPMPQMQTVAAAGFAINSQFLEGISSSGFIQASGNVTQANLNSLTGGTDITALGLHNHDSAYMSKTGNNVTAGNFSTSGNIDATGAASSIGVGTGAAAADIDIEKGSPPALRIGSTGTSGDIMSIDFYAGGGATNTASIKAVDNANTLTFQTGGATAMTINANQTVSFSNSVAASALALSAYLSLGKYATGSEPVLTAAQEGTIWENTTSHAVRFWNGTTTQTLAQMNNVVNSVGVGTGTTVGGSATAPTVNVTYGTAANTALQGNQAFTGDITGTVSTTNISKLQGSTVTIAAPANGQVLTYNGGVWSNQAVGATAASGGNTQLQFNNAGVFGASATATDLTWNDTAHKLSLSGTSPTSDALVIPTTPLGAGVGSGNSLVRLGNSEIVAGNTNGTFLGVNQAAATADFVNYQVAGASKFLVDKNGNVTAASFSGNGANLTNLPGGSISGVVALVNGGTGTSAASANAAFNALSPMTTAGDFIYGGAAGAATRLPAGAAKQALVSGGAGVPVWSTDMTVDNTNHLVTLDAGGTPAADGFVVSAIPLGGGSGAGNSLVRLGNSEIVAGNTNGTYIGVNQGAATADYENYQVAGVSKFSVDKNGNVTAASFSGNLVGAVTSVGATAPITSSGGTSPTIAVTSGALTESTSSVLTITGAANSLLGAGATIQVKQASGTQSGYLASGDWTTFNNKLSLPSFTSGSVIVSNGTTLVQDNANFYWDANHHRLGIGAASPANQFEVNTPTTADALAQTMISASAAANKALVLQENASQTANMVEIQNSSGAVLYSIESTGTPTANTDLVNKNYVNTVLPTFMSNYLKIDGTVAMTGANPLNIGTNRIINVSTPTGGTDVANKTYVDTNLATRSMATTLPNDGQAMIWNNGVGQWQPTNIGAASLPADVAYVDANNTFTTYQTNTDAGIASHGAEVYSGSPYTAGTAATNKPQLLLEDAATSTGWSTHGTYLGINGKTGFSGNLIDVQLNGSSQFSVSSGGVVTGVGSGLTGLNAGNISTGTLAVAQGGTGLASTSQNFVFAGPTVGSGAPGFRALVAGDIPILNQSTTGTAAVATAVTTTAVSANAIYYPLFVSATSGNQAADLGAGLTFNPSTNTLTTTTFAGALTGNATNVTGVVALANGGTGTAAGSANAAFNALSPMTTAGDLIYGGASGAATRLPAGTSGYFLTTNGAAAPSWTQTLPLANGGTNNGSLAATNGGVIYTDGTKFQNSGAGTSGQVLTSGGVGAPTWANSMVATTNTTVSGATALTMPTTGHSLQNLTMAASATIAIPAGGYVGQFMVITTCQNATGGFTPTYSGSGVTLHATYPAGWPTTTASKCDVCGWIYYSTNNWILTGCNLNE